MREIKFRAWDTQAKCMLGGGGMQMNATTGNLDSLSSVVKMQYTGLKDKNGKEIYEGDIVHTRWFGRLTKTLRETNQEVYWNDEGRWSIQGRELEDIEVIGNKWESPELSKGQDNG